MPAALNSTFLYSHKFWILSSAHAANTRMNTGDLSTLLQFVYISLVVISGSQTCLFTQS